MTGATDTPRGTTRKPPGLRLAILALFCLAATLAMGQEQSLEKPQALLAFEQARISLPAGRIEWSEFQEGKEELEIRCVNRYARNGDVIFENRGDRDGWTLYESSFSRKGLLKYPQLFSDFRRWTVVLPGNEPRLPAVAA